MASSSGVQIQSGLNTPLERTHPCHLLGQPQPLLASLQSLFSTFAVGNVAVGTYESTSLSLVISHNHGVGHIQR